MTHWQKRLVQPNPTSRMMRSKSMSEVEIPKKIKKSPTRKLSVVGEDDDVFSSNQKVAVSKKFRVDNNNNNQQQQNRKNSLGQPRQSQRLSIPEQPSYLKVEVTRATIHEPRKTPRPVANRTAKQLPKRLEIFGTEERPPILSPVPLPPGVQCIDPVDNGMFEYWPDFIAYLKIQEKQWVVEAKRMMNENESFKTNRCLLMNWVLELCLHFKVSQETLYHTVRLIDSTLAKRKVPQETLQLVAVAALFIASKLEEYYPPSVSELLAITEDSYTTKELYQMEMKILKLFHGQVYGPDPMIFLNRYMQAAFMEGDEIFTNTCKMFVDILIPSINYSSDSCSRKAATAVFAAKLLLDESGDRTAFWTPTLVYYTGYTEEDLKPLAQIVLVKFCKVLKCAHSSTNMNGFVKKFSSRSMHKAVIKKFILERPQVQEIVLNYFNI